MQYSGFEILQLRTVAPSESQKNQLSELEEERLNVNIEVIPSAVPKEKVVIPLIRKFGKYFLDVSLNGKRVKAMMDWGSGTVLALPPSTVLDIKAKLSKKKLAFSAVDGKAQVVVGTLDRVEIHAEKTVTIREVPFIMGPHDIDFSLFGFIPIFRGKALIGMPFLAAFEIFAIDMSQDQLFLSWLPDVLKEKDTVIVPCKYRDGTLYITVNIEGKEHDLVVDIGGSQFSIVLCGETAQCFSKTHSTKKTGSGTSFGKSRIDYFTATAESVTVGDHKIEKCPVTLVPSTSHSSSGLVGNDFFGRTCVGVDLKKKELYFISTRKQAVNNRLHSDALKSARR